MPLIFGDVPINIFLDTRARTGYSWSTQWHLFSSYMQSSCFSWVYGNQTEYKHSSGDTGWTDSWLIQTIKFSVYNRYICNIYYRMEPPLKRTSVLLFDTWRWLFANSLISTAGLELIYIRFVINVLYKFRVAFMYTYFRTGSLVKALVLKCYDKG